MTSLSEHLAGAANPEPFPPYADYLAWLAEDARIMEHTEDYANGLYRSTPTIAQKIEKLLSEMENGTADPAEILGYLSGYVETALEIPRILANDSIERKTALAALEYLRKNSYPKGHCYLANVFEWGSFELDIAEDTQKAQEWLLEAAEGGDLRAQYDLGIDKIQTETENAITEGLKWLWTAAQGLYPPALNGWKQIFVSINEPELLSYLKVERGQIDEMADSLSLLFRIMNVPQDKQTRCVENILWEQKIAWERHGNILYPESVRAALTTWEQNKNSADAIDTLVRTLYRLACLDQAAPIMKSPAATPTPAPQNTPIK